MTKQRKIALIIAVLLVLSGLVALAFGALTDESPGTSTSTSPAAVVTFTDDSSLKALLLERQLPVVEQGLREYIKSNIGTNVTEVKFVTQPAIASNGLIEITIETDNPQKRIKVTLDRTTYFDRIIFSVPESGYSAELPVYQTNAVD